MADQKKDVKPVNAEQKPVKRTIDTTKTLSGVQSFKDSFMMNNKDNKPLIKKKK